jgi:hypothetical protein
MMADDRKLRKVTLNLFDKDCAKLERWYGHGWSAEIRNRLREFVKEREALQWQAEAGLDAGDDE